MRGARALLPLTALLTLGGAATVPAPRVAVLTIDLNNIHKTDPDTALPGRLSRLGEALRSRLATCGYEVVAVDPEAETRAHATDGYFYEHVDVAAALAGKAEADWVVIPRLNRASAWVADLQAQVVRVSDTTLVSNRIIELKDRADARARCPAGGPGSRLDGRPARPGHRARAEPRRADIAPLPSLRTVTRARRLRPAAPPAGPAPASRDRTRPYTVGR